MTIRFVVAALLLFASGFCLNPSFHKTAARRRWAVPVGVLMIVLEIVLLTGYE